jgi:hypothetical protein
MAQMSDRGGMMGGGMVRMVVMIVAGRPRDRRDRLARARAHGGSHRTTHRADPVEVLERRFARGEVEQDEYYERRSTLQAGP